MNLLRTTPDHSRNVLRWSTLLSLFALTLLGPALAAAPATTPAPLKPTAPDQPLPDSVVMRIDEREDVTVRRFKRAVRLLDGDPDSLTPADRDRFLDLVLEQRVLAAHVVRKGVPWTPADSARYRSERDNTLLRAALSDQMGATEAKRRAAGQKDLDEQDLGAAARDSMMKDLRPKYDEELLKVVGSAFAYLPQTDNQMSASEQLKILGRMPEIAPADTPRVLARCALGDYTVADMLQAWRRLTSIYRPRINDNEGVRKMVDNGLFERAIRNAAADPAVAKRPEVAAVLADRVEFHAVNSYLAHEVMARIPTDSLTLTRYFTAHKPNFDKPARNVLVVVLLGDSVTADSLKRKFTVPGIAETLAFQAQRAGANYTQVVTPATDSALYARTCTLGRGAVGGPDHLGADWRVFKVLEIDPRTPQKFSAVRAQVQQAWLDAESERRIRALLENLKSAATVRRNETALRALVYTAPPKPR